MRDIRGSLRTGVIGRKGKKQITKKDQMKLGNEHGRPKYCLIHEQECFIEFKTTRLLPE